MDVGLLNDDEDRLSASSELPRSLGARGVLLIGFFWVCGGFYGNEALVTLAPAGVVLAVLGAMPFLFAIPVSLIMAELSAMLPVSGGQAVFVEAACGEVVGLQNACWLLLVVLADASIYPQLAAQYAAGWCGAQSWVPTTLKAGMVCVTAAAHSRGNGSTEAASAFVALVVMAPCAAFIGLGLPRLLASDVLARGFEGAASETDAGMLLAWILWNFSGWSSFGAIAGEVKRPVARTLLRGILGLVPVVFILQACPVLVSLAAEPDAGKYEAGFFAAIARRLGGAGLAVPFAIGAQFSNLGYHSSQMVTAQRTLYFLAEERSGRRVGGAAAGPGLRGYLLEAPRDGVRRIYVLACALASLCLINVPYRILLTVEIALYSVSKMLFLLSFLVLRRSRPNVPRPFVVPGGPLGAVVCAALPATVVGASLVLTFFGDWLPGPAYGGLAPFPGFHLTLCAGLVAAIFGATRITNAW